MITVIVIVASLLFATSAHAQTPLYGVLCFEESAAEASAYAYDEGGLDLQDEVVDHLINIDMACIRIPEDHQLLGYFVYEGVTIGTKKVVGIANSPRGKPELFGLWNADEPIPVSRPRLYPGQTEAVIHAWVRNE